MNNKSKWFLTMITESASVATSATIVLVVVLIFDIPMIWEISPLLIALLGLAGLVLVAMWYKYEDWELGPKNE